MVSGLRSVGRDLGRILEAFAVMPTASMVVAAAWREWYVLPSLLVAAVVPFAVGWWLTESYADAREPGKLHGMVIAATGWATVGVFGAIPFVGIAVSMQQGWFGAPPLNATMAAFLNPLNAVFESFSGFTGTGLTMSVHENTLPHTLQWWRSFTEWVGGVGVIVLTTAILARPGSGSLTLYESEARSEKIHPSIVSTVRTIWWIFLLFTFVSIVTLWLAGLPAWDAINHAMTGLATGGFSITDNSIATYDSPLVDFVLLPIMTLGSIAFPIHYLLLQGHFENVYEDLQTRWVFGFFAVGVAALVWLLYTGRVYHGTEAITFLGVTFTGQAAAIFQSVRYGAFQFVSAASCTGFQTASIGGSWSAASQLVVSFAMVVGAASGSTVGGIKLVRLATLLKGAAFRVSGVFYPQSAVRTFRLGDRKLSSAELTQEFEEAAIISLLWGVFLVLGIAVLLLVVPMGPDGFALENVVFEVASAQGNVGLSTGITGPDMPTAAKLVFLLNMWVGRLEIIPVLVTLRGVFRGFGVYRQ
ncbi:TrkH family potassium uptake protein [Halocalculus aciditolerans]|uniref:Potassium transporter Trk n=1 Tax=Halocalculus aciditolerans TaxID=1383812 RepID=A0A830F8W8_9EURY|nr:TrkH family potassium uptake protein [Halocalculus aciditolerans]GGL50819.1 potassium transporter Trk [Halocalculus aciditolerans]